MKVYVVTYVTTDNVMSSGALRAFKSREDALQFAKEASEENVGSDADIDHNEEGSFSEYDGESHQWSIDKVDLI